MFTTNLLVGYYYSYFVARKIRFYGIFSGKESKEFKSLGEKLVFTK